MLDEAQFAVTLFHKKHGAPVGQSLDSLSDYSPDLRACSRNVSTAAKEFFTRFTHLRRDEDLRVHLMLEELGEVLMALYKRDKVELADGLADLLYVVIGTAVAYGIPISKIFREVHRSNMTKKVSGNVRVLDKGDAYEPPRIAEIMAMEEGVR